MKKHYTAIFFLLAVLALSISTGFAFASEDNGDDRYDDDRYDDDRYDDDRYDDDRYDDDRYDDDRYDDDRYDDDRYDDDRYDDDRYDDDRYDDDRYDDDRYDDDRYDDDRYDDDRYDDDRYDDDRYDDDRYDDDRYDDDRYDDDRYDDDRYDDDRISDGSKTSEFFKREVRSETLGFQTEIKIEIEFVSNTADTNQLIDEIIDKFSLTREEADDELRTERSDDQRLGKALEVKIEKRGNTSKVEVDLETVIDSTSRGEILDAIVKSSHLTREQINEQLRFDSDKKDGDSNDDDPYQSRDDYREERKEYREERKEYRESKVCTNEGECVEDEEFKKTREAYRQEREEYRSDKQLGSENKQQTKKYAKMLQILGNAKFGDSFVLPPRIQMLLVEDHSEIECRGGFELVFKTSNDIPMCVKDTTTAKLLEKGIAYK